MRQSRRKPKVLKYSALAYEVLECRRLLAFGIAHVTPNLADANKLFEFQTRNVDFNTLAISQPNQPFRYGFSKGSDDTPGDSCCARGFDDRVVAGDWSGKGYTSVGTAQAIDGSLRWLLDSDRDSQVEYAFRFGFATDLPVVGNFDGQAGSDIAVARNSNGGLEWFVTKAASAPASPFPRDDAVRPVDMWFRYGLVGDTVLTGNFDNDNIADIVAVRVLGSDLQWLFHLSADAAYPTDGTLVGNDLSFVFGSAGNIPVVGDWNGDGQSDIGVVNAVDGQTASWTISALTPGTLARGEAKNFSFGQVQSGQANSFLFGNWANNYFNGGGPALVNGPNLTGNNWSNPAVWSNGVLPVSGETVVIEQPTGVEINFDAGTFSGSLITRNKLVVSGGAMTLTDGSIAEIGVSGGTLTVNKSITSGAPLGVSGTGTITLNATQQFSSVTLSGGTIVVGFNARTNPFGSAGPVNVTAGGTILVSALPDNVSLSVSVPYFIPNALSITGELTVGNATSTAGDAALREGNSYFHIDGVISGTGSLRKSGRGIVYLTGNNSFTGATTIDTGDLLIGNVNGLGTTAGATRINGGSLSVFPPSTAFTVPEPITVGSGALINLRKQAGLSGSISLENNATLQVEPGISLPSSLSLNGAATIEVIAPFDSARGKQFVITTTLTGNGDLNWTVPSTFTVSVRGPNSRTGVTRVQGGGTLELASADALPADGSVDILNGSTLDLNGNAISLSSLSANGIVRLGTTTAGSLTLNNAVPLTFAGTITGIGNFSKSGAADLTLISANNFEGNLNVVQGRLIVGANNVLPDNTAVVVSTNAQVDFNFNETVPSVQNSGTINVQSAPTVLTVSGIFLNQAGGTLNLGANNTNFSGGLDNSGTVNLNGTQLAVSTLVQRSGLIDDTNLAGSIVAQGNYDLRSGTINARLLGSVGLTKTSSGTVVLSGQNSFTNAVDIQLGTLSLALPGSLPDVPLSVSSGASLQLNNNNQTLAALTGAGQVQLGSATLTIHALDPSIFDGAINGTGAVRKTGNGLWTIQTAQSFTGGLEVFDGSLQANGLNSLGSGIVQVQSAGTLNIAAAQTIRQLTNAGTLNLNTSTVSLTGNFTNAGTFNPSNGTLETIGTTGTQTLDMGSATGGSILVTGSSVVQLSSASNGLTMNTVTVRGGNLNTGSKQLSLQSLVMDSQSATLSGTGSISSATALDLRAGTVSVPLTGVAGLRKSTAGSVTLARANSYQGNTSVEQGLLTVQLTGGLGSGAVDVATTGTLSLAGTQTIASLINSGSVQAGSAIVRIAGNLDNTGTLAIGTLETSSNGTSTVRLNLGANSTITNLTTVGSAPVQLASTSASVTLGGTLQVGLGSLDTSGLNIQTSQLILSGNNATELKGTGSITSTSAIDLRSGIVAVTLNGTGGLNKTTAGVVALNVSNGMSGPVDVIGGTLQANGLNSLGSGIVQVQSAGALNIAAAQTIRQLTNAGTLNLNTSTVSLTGNFTNAGTFNPSNGTLETIGTTGTQTLDIGFATGGSILVTGSSVVQLNSASNSLTMNTVTVRGGNLNTGSKQLSLQSLVMDSQSATLSGTGSISSTAALDLRAGTVSIPLAGVAGLRKSTAGSVTLARANSYQGNTSVEQGLLTVQLTGGLGSGAVDVAPTGTLSLAGTQTIASLINSGSVQAGSAIVRIAGNLDNTGTLAIGTLETSSNGTSTVRLNLGANSTITNLTTVGSAPVQLASTNASVTLGGTLQVGLGSLDTSGLNIQTSQLILSGNNATELKGTGTITSTSAVDLRSGIVAVALNGTAGLNKTTAGVVELNVSSGLSGPVNVRAGTLRANALNSIGGDASILSSALLDLRANQTLSSLFNAGTLIGNNSTISVGGDFTNSGDFQPGTSRLIATPASTQVINLGTSSAHSITIRGAGNVSLTAANNSINLTGDLVLERGTASLGNNNLTSDSLQLDGNARIEGVGGVTSASDYDLRSGTVAASLRGNVGLRKSTAGTVAIVVPSSYTGTTLVLDSGRLIASVDSAIGSGAVQVESNAILNLTGTQSVQSIANQGSVLAEGATLRVSGNFQSPGTFDNVDGTLAMIGTNPQRLQLGNNSLHHLTIAGNAVQLESSRASLDMSGNLRLQSGVFDAVAIPVFAQSFVLEGSADTTLRGLSAMTSVSTYDLRSGVVAMELAGNVGLRKSTAGTVRIDVAATYSGNTQVIEGVLESNVTNPIAAQSPVEVNSAGTVNFRNFDATIHSLTNQGVVLVGEAELVVSNNLVNQVNAVFNGGNATLAIQGDLQNFGDWASSNVALQMNGSSAKQTILATNAVFASIEHNGPGQLSLDDSLRTSGLFVQNNGSVRIADSLEAGNLDWRQGDLMPVASSAGIIIPLDGAARFASGLIAAPIVGGSDWTKTGPGAVVFASPISYAQSLQIEDGKVEVVNGSALPDQRDLKIAQTGSLTIQTGAANFSQVDIAGDLDVREMVLQVGLPNEGNLVAANSTISGTVTGSGGMVKLGNNRLTLSGTNAIEGEVRVMQGELQLASDLSLATNSSVSVQSGGVVRVGSASVRSNSLNGEGELALDAGATFETSRGVFGGIVSGQGTFNKVGQAPWVFTSASRGDFTGNVRVVGGSLVANGQLPTSNVSVGTGTVLSGSGVLGNLTIESGGRLSPGNSPGLLSLNSLQLQPGSVLVMELEGTRPGISHDQVAVKGTAELLGMIEARISDSLKNSLSSTTFFDLLTYGKLIGQPLLQIVNGNSATLIRLDVLPSVYRLLVLQPTPPFIFTDNGPGIIVVSPGPTTVVAAETLSDSQSKPAVAESLGIVVSMRDEAMDPEASQWLDESALLPPTTSGPGNESPAEVAAIDSVLADGLSLELQMIASDMRPRSSSEFLNEVEFPQFNRLAEVVKLDLDSPDPDSGVGIPWTALSGLATTFLGTLTMGLAIMNRRRKNREREILNSDSIVISTEDDRTDKSPAKRRITDHSEENEWTVN